MGGLDTRAGERPYWEDMDYSGANRIVKGNLMTGQRAAITIGYYLKHIRDNQLYLEGGYQSFGEYVRAECGLSESTASRHIARMEQFSEGGNSPKLAARYAEYSASQLQEMLYLTDEQREQASPDMTVKEIRAIRQEENMVAGIDLACEHSDNGVCVVLSDAETEQPCVEGPCPYEEGCDAASEDAVMGFAVELPDLEDAPGPARCITGQSGSGICGAAAYCGQPYTCCAQCDKDCNGRCGWIPRTAHAEEVATSQEKVVYANRAYIKAPPYHLPKFDLQEVLGYLREKEQELDDFVSAGNIPEKTITKMKMTVEGLKLLAALTLAPIAEDVQNE